MRLDGPTATASLLDYPTLGERDEERVRQVLDEEPVPVDVESAALA